MSTRGKEYQSSKRDRNGRAVPVVKTLKPYKKNYKFERNK